jgi:hypothetical protein
MQTRKAEPTLGKHSREEPGIFTVREEASEEPASKRRRPPRTAENSRKRNAVLWDSRYTSMLIQGAGENGGPSTQPDPLPVKSTTRSDLPFIDEEEEDDIT